MRFLRHNSILFFCAVISATSGLSTALLLIGGSTDAYASSSHIGRAGDGYEAGRAAGVDDRQEGREHDSKCPPNDSLVWCGSYKVGYEAGWFSSGVVEAAEDDRNNNNND